jgi:hypothetical protein
LYAFVVTVAATVVTVAVIGIEFIVVLAVAVLGSQVQPQAYQPGLQTNRTADADDVSLPAEQATAGPPVYRRGSRGDGSRCRRCCGWVIITVVVIVDVVVVY